ncbi:MAG: hypothetical protein HY775_11010 [Acidobacteria bacterium]|nr:hypothetical protein [Acidobacteriota bacterium]
MTRWKPLAALCALLAAAPALAAPETGSVPRRLSENHAPAAIDSGTGSGHFGSWEVDRFGLPAFRYTADEETDPLARQPELGGDDLSTDAWHQLGNDHIVANAYNHGYVQLWSQDRVYQWINKYEPGSRHYSGGYGYLNAGGQVVSTMYDDRPGGTTAERDFGAGYARRSLAPAGALAVEDFVYAPFGDDPVLLHDVAISNPTDSPVGGSWWEYWDVNPVAQVWGRTRGTLSPTYDPATKTLLVDQIPDDDDLDPLSIYASALQGEVTGFETDSGAFFGPGTRALPSTVAADAPSGSIAPPAAPGQTGTTLLAFRTPVSIPARGSVSLRYAFGAAHRAAVPEILSRYAGGDPLAASEGFWREWLPKASFGAGLEWLARELQWDAYMVRSGTTYEESCGHHILSQGGYYQYGLGLQGGFRDQLGLSLSMISLEPEIAREVIRYSAQEQEAATGHAPYAMGHMCTPVALPSADLDFWFLLATSEYALATRDFDFFDEVVRFVDAGRAPLWDHVRLAYRHMERVVRRGPHGGYLVSASTGDWTDFSAQFMQMTESLFITAQLAYVYPRVAEVADARGDARFATALRKDAVELLDVLRREWTGRWFPRGYSGSQQIGVGTIYEEPQPWALLAGAADPGQAATLMDNIRLLLTGDGAPGGPSLIGTAQSPAAGDPRVTERALPIFQEAGALGSYGGGNAVYLGGVWYALNGPLVWALGSLDEVPGAATFAWGEYLRNTLANHAVQFPNHWDGTISVDDVCWAWYSKDRERCGDEALSVQYRYAGQILNKHAWWLWAIQKLAGIVPERDGYRIEPHLPLDAFSLRLPSVGLASEPGRLRGYVRAERDGTLRMRVRLPENADPASAVAWVNGEPQAPGVSGRLVEFDLPAPAGTPADWAVTWE